MKPSPEIEVKITALLLGELAPDEAADLQLMIERDPELAKLQARLQETIALVRETATVATAQPGPTPLRMSEKRRTALLQQFKTVRPKEFAKEKSPRANWLGMVGVAACLALTLVLASMLLPALAKAKKSAQKNKDAE